MEHGVTPEKSFVSAGIWDFDYRHNEKLISERWVPQRQLTLSCRAVFLAEEKYQINELEVALAESPKAGPVIKNFLDRRSSQDEKSNLPYLLVAPALDAHILRLFIQRRDKILDQLAGQILSDPNNEVETFYGEVAWALRGYAQGDSPLCSRFDGFDSYLMTKYPEHTGIQAPRWTGDGFLKKFLQSITTINPCIWKIPLKTKLLGLWQRQLIKNTVSKNESIQDRVNRQIVSSHWRTDAASLVNSGCLHLMAFWKEKGVLAKNFDTDYIPGAESKLSLVKAGVEAADIFNDEIVAFSQHGSMKSFVPASVLISPPVLPVHGGGLQAAAAWLAHLTIEESSSAPEQALGPTFPRHGLLKEEIASLLSDTKQKKVKVPAVSEERLVELRFYQAVEAVSLRIPPQLRFSAHDLEFNMCIEETMDEWHDDNFALATWECVQQHPFACQELASIGFSGSPLENLELTRSLELVNTIVLNCYHQAKKAVIAGNVQDAKKWIAKLSSKDVLDHLDRLDRF
eukprot:GHVQ01011047.1.p1 GENE.GHVQ01011047.1~~GHVQ01011047.1.p1  ORF type:complete len:514 (+),score=31.17 GHVQ01011047.1:1175-2716(+)